MALGLSAALLTWSPAALADPVPVPPKAVPSQGTVIRPPTQVDPGIQAKTPSPTHFPMPVIKPGTVGSPPPR